MESLILEINSVGILKEKEANIYEEIKLSIQLE